MKRAYNLTKDEMNKILGLRRIKTYTYDNEGFQKFLLNLKENIFLGSGEFSSIFNRFYFKDEKITAFMYTAFFDKLTGTLTIKPKSFETDKPVLSNHYKKLLLYPKPENFIGAVEIEDMVIDSNSFAELLSYFNFKDIRFKNCYFEDNFIFGSGHGDYLEFEYCNLPTLKLINNLNYEGISIENSKIRNDLSDKTNIKAKVLDLSGTKIDFSKLFLLSNMNNLEKITINNKVLDLSDLIKLNKSAPNLEEANLAATIGIEEYREASALDFYPFIKNLGAEYKTSIIGYDEYTEMENKSLYQGLINKKLRFKNFSEIKLEKRLGLEISIKSDRKIRNVVIDKLKDAVNSCYVSESAKNFIRSNYFENKLESLFERREKKIRKALYNYIEKGVNGDEKAIVDLIYNSNSFPREVNQYKRKLEKSFYEWLIKNVERDARNSYKEAFKRTIIKEIDYLVEYYEELNYNIPDLRKEVKIIIRNYCKEVCESNIPNKTKLEVIDLVENFEITDLKLSIFSILHVELKNLFRPLYNELDKIDDVAHLYLPEQIKSMFLLEKHIENIEKDISLFSNKRKTNYSFLKFISIMDANFRRNFINANRESREFNEKVSLNKPERSDFEKNKEVISKEFINNIRFGKYADKLIIPEMNKHKQKICDDLLWLYHTPNKYTLSDFLEEPGYQKPFGEVIKSYRFPFKYLEPYSKLFEKTNHKEYLENVKSNSKLNEADAHIYLNYKYNDHIDYVEKKCVYILKYLYINGFGLTENDYQEIRNRIVKMYNFEQLNYFKNDSVLYFETIKYITGKYPDFLERYIGSDRAKEIMNRGKMILEVDSSMRDEYRRELIKFVEESRVDKNMPQKIKTIQKQIKTGI